MRCRNSSNSTNPRIDPTKSVEYISSPEDEDLDEGEVLDLRKELEQIEKGITNPKAQNKTQSSLADVKDENLDEESYKSKFSSTWKNINAKKIEGIESEMEENENMKSKDLYMKQVKYEELLSK